LQAVHKHCKGNYGKCQSDKPKAKLKLQQKWSKWWPAGVAKGWIRI